MSSAKSDERSIYRHVAVTETLIRNLAALAGISHNQRVDRGGVPQSVPETAVVRLLSFITGHSNKRPWERASSHLPEGSISESSTLVDLGAKCRPQVP